MATSGQTLNDRINAARYALAGQGLARCVCKATTEEVIGPKKKHLDYLLACTHEPNVSIPQLANLLIERTNHIQWVVVFKALVTVHHLMSYGNERFIQYLASSNYSFELSTFLDKTSGRDFSMSTFIRRYSRYINEKAISYRNSAFDFCKIKRGNEGVLRLMPIDRLLKTLPVLQNQLDALLEFDCRASDLNNGVINASFMLLLRDLIGLFACFNDGIINLLNKYFSLNKKMCREAFELYKKFLIRMDKVSEFLKVAESVGMDKDEIPYPPRAPSSLIENLEHHLQALESNKKNYKPSSNNYGKMLGEITSSAALSESGFALSTGGAMSSSSSIQANKSSASNSSSSMTTMNESELGLGGSSFKDDEVRRALEEEARVLSLYGSSEANRSSSRTSPGQLRASANQDGDSLKFAVTTTPKTIDDIFGDPNSFGSNNNNNNNNNVQSRNKANGLGNPISFDVTETVKQQIARPGVSSIRTTIQSASTTLAGVDAKSGANNTKKASDDLFCLLDSAGSAAVGSTVEPATSPALKKNPTTPGNLTTELSAGLQDTSRQQTALISPFENSSPFVLPTNGQGSQLVGATPLKPGNPFPEVETNNFPSAFSAETLKAQPVLNPALKASNNLPQQTGANYTNLGGLEGFGDVLRPKQAGFRDPSQTNSDHGSSASRPSFMNSGGLSSTGLFKGDLDSTLANLAQNLTLEGMSKPKK